MKKLSFFISLGVLLSGCTSKQEICRQLGAGMISDYEAYEKLGRPKLKNIGGFDEETWKFCEVRNARLSRRLVAARPAHWPWLRRAYQAFLLVEVSESRLPGPGSGGYRIKQCFLLSQIVTKMSLLKSDLAYMVPRGSINRLMIS